jgi:malate synthase
VWQWVKHGATANDGRPITAEFVTQVIRETAAELSKRYGRGAFDTAARIYERMMTDPEFPEFLTLVAYEYID